MGDLEHMGEENLIPLFRKGDMQAFSSLYRRYFNDLYSYGRSLGTESEQLRDMIQDIFYNVYSDRRQFSSESHIKFYLLKSLRNAVIDLGRKKTKEIYTDDECLRFSIHTTVLDDLMDEEYRLALERKIDHLLSILTDRQREAIFLKYMEGLEYAEIARIMTLTPHGARKLVSRAMGRLKNASSDGNAEILFALLAAGKIIF